MGIASFQNNQYRSLRADMNHTEVMMVILVACCAGLRVVKAILNMRSNSKETEQPASDE